MNLQEAPASPAGVGSLRPFSAGPLRPDRLPEGDLVPHDLGSIGVEELVGRAAFLCRMDRKYLVERAHVPGILSELDPQTRVLDIEGMRTQSYHSTYLDTPDLAGYHSAATRRRRRFKVRTRTYVESDLCFLEVKTRGPRGQTVKHRIPRASAQVAWRGLTAPEQEWVDRELSPLGRGPGTAATLEASLVVTYRRATLLMADGAGRATIDSDLEWVAPRGPALVCPDLVIIETKSGSRPSDLDHLLWASGHRPAPVSKYATALAAVDPSLPANRWARVLRAHFPLAS